jgi:hypothetical protein
VKSPKKLTKSTKSTKLTNSIKSRESREFRFRIFNSKLMRMSLVLALLLASVSGFADRRAYAAPALHFSDLPGVFDMFLPPPAPTPVPIWGSDLPEPEFVPIPIRPPVQAPQPAPMPITPSVPDVPTATPQPGVSVPVPTPAPTPPPLTPQIPVPQVTPAPQPGGLADISGHWAHDAIMSAHNHGMINIQNNNVRPNDPITRGEFAYALMGWIDANYGLLRTLGFTYDGTALNVVGVPHDHPLRARIADLAAMGLVGGNVDFMPDENVQRQEAARILLNVFLRLPDSRFNEFYFAALDVENVLGRYNDQTRISAWARDAVAIMTDNDFMSGTGSNFRPQVSLTRAEAYVIFQNIERSLRN